MDPNTAAPDAFRDIPFGGYGEHTSKPTVADRLRSSVLGSPVSPPPPLQSQPHMSGTRVCGQRKHTENVLNMTHNMQILCRVD